MNEPQTKKKKNESLANCTGEAFRLSSMRHRRIALQGGGRGGRWEVWCDWQLKRQGVRGHTVPLPFTVQAGGPPAATGGHCALRWRLLLHRDASRLFITETNWGLVCPRRGCEAVCGITACTQLQAGYYWTEALVFAAHHSGRMTFTVHRETDWG